MIFMVSINRTKLVIVVLQWHFMMMEHLKGVWAFIIQIWDVSTLKKILTKRKVFLMADQKNGNAKENENVIQGPWPKSRRKVKIPDEELLELRENIEFAEELNQKVIIHMVQMLGENGINVGDVSFIRDLGLIVEMTKGSIYRSMGIPHPTHTFFETLVDVSVDEADNSVHSEIDLDMLEKFVEMSKYLEDDDEDDDPEIS